MGSTCTNVRLKGEGGVGGVGGEVVERRSNFCFFLTM